MTLRRPERAYRAFATKSGGWGVSRVKPSGSPRPSAQAHQRGRIMRKGAWNAVCAARLQRTVLCSPKKRILPALYLLYTSCIIGRTPAAGKCSWSHLARIMGQGCSTLKVLPQMVMSNPLSLIRSSVSADASPQYATALSRVRRSANFSPDWRE